MPSISTFEPFSTTNLDNYYQKQINTFAWFKKKYRKGSMLYYLRGVICHLQISTPGKASITFEPDDLPVSKFFQDTQPKPAMIKNLMYSQFLNNTPLIYTVVKDK